jgi:lipoprotein signal peptidase
MIGQGILKSVAFTANSIALRFLHGRLSPSTNKWTSLLLAAAFAGFITSFLTVPFERIKVMMQAQQKQTTNNNHNKNDKIKYYSNEIDCLRAIIRNEGISGSMVRGLGTTLAREVPSFVIYFVFYAVLMQSKILTRSFAPLIGGALAGCACWIPVYPVDVVKTIVQNTEGGTSSSSKTSWDITKELYRTGGIGVFFDGITPKMLRAAINHAVTFFLYDLIVAFGAKLEN